MPCSSKSKWSAKHPQGMQRGTWPIFPCSLCTIDTFLRRYGVFTLLKALIVMFHFPSNRFPFPLCSSLVQNRLEVLRQWVVDYHAFIKLLLKIECCLCSFKRSVNCLFGHHFVAQISSNPIGSWQHLFTSSTQYLHDCAGWVALHIWTFSMFHWPNAKLGDPGFHPVPHATKLFLLCNHSHKCSGCRTRCHSKLEQMFQLLLIIYLIFTDQYSPPGTPSSQHLLSLFRIDNELQCCVEQRHLVWYRIHCYQ